jgi:hypothetical protein
MARIPISANRNQWLECRYRQTEINGSNADIGKQKSMARIPISANRNQWLEYRYRQTEINGSNTDIGKFSGLHGSDLSTADG